MKTLPRIDDQLKHWINDRELNKQCPTYREIYKQACSMAVNSAQNSSGERSIDMFQLGIKIDKAPKRDSETGEGDDVKLEEAEFKLLEEVTKTNVAKWLSHFHAQACLRLIQAQAGVNGRQIIEADEESEAAVTGGTSAERLEKRGLAG